MSSQELAPRTTIDWLAEQSGVEVAHGANGELLIAVPPGLENKVNVLAPISQIAQMSSSIKPTVKTCRLTIGSDTYKQGYSKNRGDLHALTRQGLMKLADLAGIQFIDENIDYMGGAGVTIQVVGHRRGPDGVWRPHRATKAVWFDRLERKIKREMRETAERYNKQPPSEDDLEKRVDEVMEHIVAIVETKAMNRLIRSFLSIKSVYTLDELRKPFFIIGYSFVPDASDPNVRDLIAANYGTASAELYGSQKADDPPGRLALSGANIHDVEAHDDEDDVVSADELTEPPEEVGGEVEDVEPKGEEELQPPENALFPRPDDNFAFTSGPYAGQFVNDVVASDEGLKYFAGIVLKLGGEHRDRGVCWLEWATQESLGDTDIAFLARD